jgi:hypothetical protein
MIRGSNIAELKEDFRELKEVEIEPGSKRTDDWLSKQPTGTKIYWFNNMKCLSGGAGYLAADADGMVIDVLTMIRS